METLRTTRRLAHLVFRCASGEPVNASTFSRTWTPVRTKVGMPPRWGFHGLRHYYATLLIHAGARVKTVQLALGHSTPTITLNEYVHEWPDALDRTRALVDGALGVRKRRPRRLGAEHDRRFLRCAQLVPKIRSAGVRAGQGTARG
jgi:integrase